MQRKTVLMLLSLLLTTFYMILTDPYSGLTMLDDIPYAIALIFLIKVFILSITLIAMMTYVVDIITDSVYGVDEKELVRRASNTPSGAGYVVIAKSIVFLAGAIIVLGVLLYTKTN